VPVCCQLKNARAQGLIPAPSFHRVYTIGPQNYEGNSHALYKPRESVTIQTVCFVSTIGNRPTKETFATCWTTIISAAPYLDLTSGRFNSLDPSVFRWSTCRRVVRIP